MAAGRMAGATGNDHAHLLGSRRSPDLPTTSPLHPRAVARAVPPVRC